MKIINTDNIYAIEISEDTRSTQFDLVINMWVIILNFKEEEFSELNFIGSKAKEFKDLLDIELPKKKPKK